MAQFAAVYDAGLCRNIGVSNFTKPYIAKAIELLGDRKIFTNQVELHVYLHNTPIVADCRSKDITMTAYSPLARGAVLDDPVLQRIGAAHEATASQIALAWLLGEGHIIIPSAGSKGRIAENLGAGDITLTAEQHAEVTALGKDMRLVDGPWCPTWDAA